MPTYEYACQACGHRFDEFQSITAKPLKTCPACKARKLQRLIGTGAGILFKGSGFYATDYRSSDYRSKARSESGSASASSSSSSSSDASSSATSETKAGKKSEKKPKASAAD